MTSIITLHVVIIIPGIRKKIDAKKKDCPVLQKWKKSVVNHMYWCAASCEDDDPDLKDAKWLSITNHIMNKHTIHKNPLFPNCLRERLHGRERKKKWLKPGTYKYYTAVTIICLERVNAVEFLLFCRQTTF